jgi:uncharacterized membrane protein
VSRSPSFLARGLEPVVHALGPLLLVWTAITAGLWWIGDEWIGAISNPGLRAAVAWISSTCDLLWLLLAALNLYLHFVAREGLARARGFAVVIIASAAALAAASTWTGQPLGHVVYTARLGARLGPVPLGWLLLWIVVVLGGRAFVERMLPRASHAAVSVWTGFAALGTAANLEPIATRLRLYWFWYDPATHLPCAPPWQNYAAWLLVPMALGWMLREQLGARGRRTWESAAILPLFNGLLLLGHLRLALGR